MLALTLLVPLEGALYSEYMRKKSQEGGADSKPLFLPADLPQDQPAIQRIHSNRQVRLDYQPEPHLDNLPPHLTRFLGMLLYYTNGSVYVVYTSQVALHHQQGIRPGDRILSINGKHVNFYKDQFFYQLNEVRSEPSAHINIETGSPRRQQIRVLPNINQADRNLDKLLIGMKLNNQKGWQRSPTLSLASPTNPRQLEAAKTARRQFFKPIEKSTLVKTGGMNGNTLEFFGMKVIRQNGRLFVQDVFASSAAAMAGVQPGDELTMVDDRPASRYYFGDLQQISQKESVLIGWHSRKTAQIQTGIFHKSPPR